MNSLFQGFLNALKARIVPLWTKIRLYTKPSYIRMTVLRKLIQYFRNMTDLRPKDKKDYYGFFGWLISKRLAFLVVITIGMCSAFYLTVVHPVSISKTAGAVKTYSYKSIPLRFAEGEVRILGKSKYLAYEGTVKDGFAQGRGQLFRPDGSLVYAGNFVQNKFEGAGVSYYPTGQIQYNGAFQNNMFNGNGTLYRENGSKEYIGSFIDNMKEGEGTLYDSAGNHIFHGDFSKDHLLYSDFLGKSTEEIANMYTGKKSVYTDENYFAVYAPDIHALYYGNQGEENLSDKVMVEGVYVLDSKYFHGDQELTHVAEIAQIMGKAVYEGNSYLTMPEAVAIHNMNQTEKVLHGDVAGVWDRFLSDATIVNEYDKSYNVYIYTYVMEGLRYTFFCKDRSGDFVMYLVEKEQ